LETRGRRDIKALLDSPENLVFLEPKEVMVFLVLLDPKVHRVRKEPLVLLECPDLKEMKESLGTEELLVQKEKMVK
jgi:hypothetical protein